MPNIPRRFFKGPLTLFWDVNDPVYPNQLKAPMYAQLLDGRWVIVEAIRGGMVKGEIVPWGDFSQFMAEQRTRLTVLSISYRSNWWIGWVAVGAGFVGVPVMSVWLMPGMAMLIVGWLTGFTLLKEAIKFGNAMRLITVVDPGPPPSRLPDDSPFGLPPGAGDDLA